MALVRSSHCDVMTGPGDRPGTDMTARLLLALTALYAQRPAHTAEEQHQYIELAVRLIDRVETATRAAVAGMLQQHPDAPAEVIERLGPSLPSAACGDGKEGAREGKLDGEPHSTSNHHRCGNQPADDDPRLAGGECASTQLAATAPEVGEAFFAASPAERRRLLSLIGRRCDDRAPPQDTERLYGRIDAAALHGRIDEFTREFERLIDIPNSLCERILNDPSGEPLVVAAKAAGMPIAVLQHILLVGPAVSHSVQRVYDLTELYRGLDGRAARDLLAAWRIRAKPDDPIFETGPDARGRRPDATHPPPCLPPHAREGRAGASLRSRFGALTERVQSQAVNARPDRGNAAHRGLRSR